MAAAASSGSPFLPERILPLLEVPDGKKLVFNEKTQKWEHQKAKKGEGPCDEAAIDAIAHGILSQQPGTWAPDQEKRASVHLSALNSRAVSGERGAAKPSTVPPLTREGLHRLLAIQPPFCQKIVYKISPGGSFGIFYVDALPGDKVLSRSVAGVLAEKLGLDSERDKVLLAQMDGLASKEVEWRSDMRLANVQRFIAPVPPVGCKIVMQGKIVPAPSGSVTLWHLAYVPAEPGDKVLDKETLKNILSHLSPIETALYNIDRVVDRLERFTTMDPVKALDAKYR